MLRTRSLLPVLTAAALLLASPLTAQETPLAGTFVLDRDAGDDLEGVVEQGVELMKSWWLRPFARGRLEETNRPYQWTRIASRDGAVAIATDRWSLEIPWDGGIEDWERGEGDVVDVTATVEGSLLRVVFQGEDGNRVNVYRLADEGRVLVIDVTVVSDRLSEPLGYQLVYRREEPEAVP